MARNKVRGVYEKKPGSGIWYIRYSVGGRLVRKRIGTKSDAIDALKVVNHELLVHDGVLPEKPKTATRVLFSELCENALERSRHENSKSSVRNLNGIITALLPTFGSRIASTITSDELFKWLRNARNENEWREGTFNHYVIQLRLIFRLAIESGKLNTNPARSLKRLTVDNDKPRYLTDAESSALEQTITERFPQHYDAFTFAKHTGLRAGAQFAMRWSQVDFSRRTITLPPKCNTKYRKNRVLPVNGEAWTVLARRKGNRSEFVFPEYQKPEYMLNPAQWFPAIVKAAGVEDFTWHGLRHNFASQLVMRGVNLRVIQELMGHANIAQTARYANISTDHLRECVELMSGKPKSRLAVVA